MRAEPFLMGTALVLLLSATCCASGDTNNGAVDAVSNHPAANDLTRSADADAAVQTDAAVSPEVPCTTLFGRPTEATGLTGDQCQPSCHCQGTAFDAPVYTDEELATLESLEWVNPVPALDSDPYQDPGAWPMEPEKACGILLDPTSPGSYSLHTYDSLAAVLDAGAAVTHLGACGVCSSLVNLAVYMRYNDLAGPVRQCGIDNMAQGKEAHVQCLLELGFDLPCAQIWYYNTRHTQAECLLTCMELLDAPYQNEDGTLNDCIQCDEDLSGAVFKAVSGRTRRNSGLPTALCRPCPSVAPLVHRYW